MGDGDIHYAFLSFINAINSLVHAPEIGLQVLGLLAGGVHQLPHRGLLSDEQVDFLEQILRIADVQVIPPDLLDEIVHG